MDAHSRDANPSHAHRVTHTRARSRENEPIARTNPHKVSNARARPLSRTPHSPTSAHSGTRRATHTTLSFTRSDPQQHHQLHCLILHTRAPRSHPQSLGPSITPPGSRARGPQALVSPRRSPRHPKAPRVRASLGRQSRLSARRPGGPRALSPRRGRRSSGGARLGAPALAPQPPAARPPRPGRLRGRGGALPARQPLGPLARGGRPQRPMAARGRGPVAGGPGGAGAGRAEGLTGGVAAGGGRARSSAGPAGRGECQDGPARARCPPRVSRGPARHPPPGPGQGSPRRRGTGDLLARGRHTRKRLHGLLAESDPLARDLAPISRGAGSKVGTRAQASDHLFYVFDFVVFLIGKNPGDRVSNSEVKRETSRGWAGP